MRVLVVEDDDRVARGLIRALLRHGYRVLRAASVAEALELIDEESPDVALVDMGLPDGDGGDVVRRLRDQPATATIVVTARGEEHERVIGLRAGADDYVVKPFSLAELVARVEAVSRRTRALRRAPTSTTVVTGPVELDVTGQVVRRTDVAWEASLTGIETQVLQLLVEADGAVVPRQRFVDQIWNSVTEGGSRTLDTHMASLRSKVGGQVSITTVRGAGYRLATES
ncbi:response regulator transcription factor [Nocardioides hwasunensis]|uniref:Sensory transduction protein RegX3 n=1 Tax=Nocardioides hwasunensis TaxID=397258 RepID=A0ABR8MED3_9ACTN|nr:response regulator transcription factor [Nocardioides hwasunensis]MBD3914469.1 response regulator transcription factor [Nocardioides hwasunensis]